ncbi:MAG: aldo/keto reductase [Gemmatimonadetes bacterium]|nr:aldo/keto reductase [Gemmatimonadota bacterium]
MAAGDQPKVRFGRTDLMVSRLCQGTAFRTMARSEANERGVEVLRYCLDAGVNFFDSAIAYGWGGAEKALGRAVAGRRDRAVICTKVPTSHPPPSDGEPAAFTPAYLESQLHGSLRRLGTDYLDLFLLHQADGVTGAADICAAMDAFVRAGKIRYWGISNHSAAAVSELHETALAAGTSPPAGIEDYYTVAGVTVSDDNQARTRLFEREMFPVVGELGLGVMTFSPMDQGFLAPGRKVEHGPPMEGILAELDAVARELGVSRAAVCVAWVLARPEVTSVLGGSESEEHVDQMLDGTALCVPAELMDRLDAASHRFTNEMEQGA